MGSSARKKAEKKRDFKKQKLKVGKQKPKASNHTDTGFKSKGIVVRQQSLATSAPGAAALLSHHVSMLSSRSDAQRRDSLAFIANHLASRARSTFIRGTEASVPLARLLPLILDGSVLVRAQLLKALRSLRIEEVDDGHSPEKILLYVRAGLTNLAVGVRETALDVLSWALEIVPVMLVSSAGGWTKMLRFFALLLGWPGSRVDGTSRAPTMMPTSQGSPLAAKSLNILAAYLEAGIGTHDPMEEVQPDDRLYFPLADATLHSLPRQANVFAHLGLFRAFQSDENEALQGRTERQEAFQRTLREPFSAQIGKLKKEGGELGRSAARVEIAIHDGMSDYKE